MSACLQENQLGCLRPLCDGELCLLDLEADVSVEGEEVERCNHRSNYKRPCKQKHRVWMQWLEGEEAILAAQQRVPRGGLCKADKWRYD